MPSPRERARCSAASERRSARALAGDDWIEVSALVDPADVDTVAGWFTDFGIDGVVIAPAIAPSPEDEFAVIELDQSTRISAYLPDPFPVSARRRLRRALDRLPLRSHLPRLRYRPIVSSDWAEQWRQFFGVQHIGERLVIRPTWLEYEAGPGELVIDLDPGRAFGTGQHETTRLCLAALERWQPAGARVLDLGAGSGVLSIGAARLGARSVLALDTDPTTVEVARANADSNGVGERVLSHSGSLGEGWPVRLSDAWRRADLLVANISAAVVLDLLETIASVVRAGGIVILSGFLERDLSLVERAAGQRGLEPLEVSREGDWCALVARVTGSA